MLLAPLVPATPATTSTAVPRAVCPATPWIIVTGALRATGGQDRANLALATHLARQGHPVHLIAHDVDAALAADARVTHHAVARPLSADFIGEFLLDRAATRTARRLAAQSPRVIANGGNCAWPDVNWVHYVHAAYDRPLGGSALRRLRFGIYHRHWLAAERRALTAARVIIANSQRTKRDLVERLGIEASRIHVVYCGIDAALFHEPSDGERDTTRDELQWPRHRPVVLFVGALGDTRKGLDTVIDAWRQLSTTSTDPLLSIVGAGALAGRWQQEVRRYGLERSVQFLGFRRDVPRLMRAADALVAPTRYEPYGLGIQEALACGVPAIVSATAGIAERYPESLADLLLRDAEDHEELSDRLERCLTTGVRSSTAMSGFATTLRSWSWDDMSAELVSKASLHQ